MVTPYRVTPQFWDHSTLWSDDDSEAGHSTDGGRVFGITRTRYVECDHYGCQPVAVIAHEDREQVERLQKAVFKAGAFSAIIVPKAGDGRTERLQDALREFANPTPPPCRASVNVRIQTNYIAASCGEPLGHEGSHRSNNGTSWDATEAND